MKKRIVYNLNGVVCIRQPSDWAISMMSCGGLWDEYPHGYMDVQIERKIARGMPKDTARRYARALQFGGCTTAEALEIIRDGDCLGGTAIELWDADDVPKDRWFRDAWKRSHNGGPIYVDLEKAKSVQMRHIARALRDARRKREAALLAAPEYDPSDFRRKIIAAKSVEHLRLIGDEVFTENLETA